jgi:transcription initiation factor TFIIH subunit 1
VGGQAWTVDDMSSYSSAATYKKKAGQLKIIEDGKTCIWTESGAEQPTVTFSVGNINRMQATPPTSSSFLLKVICTVPDNADPVSYQFSFASRENLDDTKTNLQNMIKKVQNGGSDENGKAKNDSAATANGKEAAETKGSGEAFVDLDAKKLLQSHELQQKLLKENKELMRTFQEAVMQGNLPATDFWSTRIHMLRAAAFSSAQKRGAYNVLSTIRPTTGSDNQINVSLTREKIHDIFEQYPIVRQAYNENVPKLSESEFWSRFLTSRLFRKLRGSKVTGNDPVDGILDKYLAVYENSSNKRKVPDDESSVFVPQYLDIEGNEENDPQKLGNQPDITMQPGKTGPDSISLIRSMNSLSKRMLHGSESADTTTSNHEYEELEKELKFRDLDDEQEMAPKIDLQLKDKASLGLVEANGNNADEKINKEQLPQLINTMKNSLNGTFSLSEEISGNYNYDDIKAADKQVSDTIRLRSMEAQSTLSADEKWGGDTKLLDQIQMCHATSIEFLRHFWIHFLSGDPSQATAISKLVTALKKSIERIDAVSALGSDDEAQAKIKRSFDPLLKSINVALQKYDEALQAQ